MKSSMKKLLGTLILFWKLQLGSFYYSFAYPRGDLGNCPRLTDNDTKLGSYDDFSNQGIFASLFISPEGFLLDPTLKIIRSKLICEVTGTRKDTASSVAFLVEYLNFNNQSNLRLATFTLGCVKNPYGSTSHAFLPAPPPMPPPGPQVRSMHFKLYDNETLFTATFDTMPKFQCGQCEAGMGRYDDQETYCISKFNNII